MPTAAAGYSKAPEKLSAIIAELHTQKTSLFASLKALTLDPQISAWLSEHDPKALEQAQESIAQVERLIRTRRAGSGNRYGSFAGCCPWGFFS